MTIPFINSFPVESSTKSAGASKFIMQVRFFKHNFLIFCFNLQLFLILYSFKEEFDRYTAYWWSGDCDNGIIFNTSNIVSLPSHFQLGYKILYLVEDETDVTHYGIPQPG